ncbi:alpha/beta hydrolase, partial [Streptomyces albidoflavus]
MRPRSAPLTALAALLGAALLAGCTSDAPADGPAAPSAGGGGAPAPRGGGGGRVCAGRGGPP